MLPFLGYATVVKVLRVLVIPFVALYVILAVLTIGKANPGQRAPRRQLADDDGRAGLHHRPDWPGLGRIGQRLLPLPAPHGQPEEHRRVGLRGHRHPAGRS